MPQNNQWRAALQERLLHEREIEENFKGRVGFLRIPKEAVNGGPYIIFNEGENTAENFSNPSHISGLDFFQVLIDVVVPYNQIAIGRSARNNIRALLSGFQGYLSERREGEIVFEKFLEMAHDPDTDNVIMGSIYLFKERFGDEDKDRKLRERAFDHR